MNKTNSLLMDIKELIHALIIMYTLINGRCKMSKLLIPIQRIKRVEE